jgi:hypothetical protein
VTLIPTGNANYVGLSGDRPTVGITSGSRFTDQNTGEESYWNGSFWVQQPRNVFSGSSIGATSFTSSITLASGAAGINFSGMQRLPVEDVGHYTVWRSGGTVFAMRTQTGIVEYSGTNNVSGITWAIQHLDDSFTGTNQKGGTVFVKKGLYTCSGEISIIGDSGNTAQGIIFRGEGINTHIRFTNSGYGLRINNISMSAFEDFKLSTNNSGVTHLLHAENDALRNSASNIWIEGVSTSGTISRNSGNTEHSGQVGMYFAGDAGTQYQWKVDKITFNQLDVGLFLDRDPNDVQSANQNYFEQCFVNNTQVGVRIRGAMNMITDLGVQATSGVGLWGIDIMSGGLHNMIADISTEMIASGSYALRMSPGSTQHNSIMNINNTATQSRLVLSGVTQMPVIINFKTGFATSATVTAGNSGAFGPAEWIMVQISGVVRKIPAFAV